MPYIVCSCGHKGNTASGDCPKCNKPIDYGQHRVADAEQVHIMCGVCGLNEKRANTNLCPKCGSTGIEKFPTNTPPTTAVKGLIVLH